MGKIINDLLNSTVAKLLYFNADISAGQADGSAVDVFDTNHALDNGYVGVYVNSLTNGEGDYTFTVSHSDTSGGTYSALGTIQITDAEAGTIQRLRVRDHKRYLKVTLTENTGEVTVATVPAFVYFSGVKERL